MSTTELPIEDPAGAQPDKTAGREHLSTTPYYTIVILTALIVVFLSEQLISIDSVVLLAAHEKSLFAAGEYWRLLTSSVVHAGILHIGFNGYALFALGRLTEGISNKANIPVVFLVSALSGGILSYIFLPVNSSLGASGGIIGMLGFLTVYSYRRRKLISNSLFKSMMFNIGFIGVLGVFVIPKVDNFAHLGGLLAGAVYGFFQVPADLYKDPREAGTFLRLAGKASLGIIILTSIVTIAMILIWYFATGDLNLDPYQPWRA